MSLDAAATSLSTGRFLLDRTTWKPGRQRIAMTMAARYLGAREAIQDTRMFAGLTYNEDIVRKTLELLARYEGHMAGFVDGEVIEALFKLPKRI